MKKLWKQELVRWYGAIPVGTLMALGADRVETVLAAQYGHGAGYAFWTAIALFAASTLWLGAKQKKTQAAQSPAALA